MTTAGGRSVPSTARVSAAAIAFARGVLSRRPAAVTEIAFVTACASCTTTRAGSAVSRYARVAVAPSTFKPDRRSCPVPSGFENFSTSCVPAIRVAAERNSGGVASSVSSSTYTLRRTEPSMKVFHGLLTCVQSALPPSVFVPTPISMRPPLSKWFRPKTTLRAL